MALTILVLAGLLGNDPGVAPPRMCSFLYQPAFCLDHELRFPAHPYEPQPGDIYLATDQWRLARLGHRVVFSGGPHHSGIVFARPDGRLALLEAGPWHSWDGAGLLDLVPAMTHYARNDRIYIRQRAIPLTAEQCRRLTIFAVAVEGRPFAWARMIAQATPLRTKGPLRTPLLGPPAAAAFNPDCPEAGLRRSYFCSELVTEACVAAGLFDPVTSRPSSTFPRDLFFGTSANPWLKCHLDLSAWYAPARWTPCPGTEPAIKRHPLLDGDSSR